MFFGTSPFVVRYSVAPGMRYMRGQWADELRRVDSEVATSGR